MLSFGLEFLDDFVLGLVLLFENGVELFFEAGYGLSFRFGVNFGWISWFSFVCFALVLLSSLL